MAGENHDAETTQEQETAQELGGEQAAQEQQEMNAAGGIDYEKQIAERDDKIAALEALRCEIAELKAQGESDRIDFKLQLAGVRNIKAARAVLDDHGGDIDKLKAAEPWLFADAPATQQGGRTGLPNAGTSSDEGKTMKRWRKLAGLDDTDND